MCAATALVAAPTPAWAEDASLTLDFDTAPSGASGRNWDSGCFDAGPALACVETSADATPRSIRHDDGKALRFPKSGWAVLRMKHRAALNPGRADFSVSAQVRLTREQIKAGANIFQKGLYDTARGQWKLQVDDGYPSCRVAGATTEGDYATAEARAHRTLTHGDWTTIRCSREGDRLRLYVDGVKVDSGSNADVDIDNREPAMVGGKHAGGGNDQFRGDLDDVSLSVG